MTTMTSRIMRRAGRSASVRVVLAAAMALGVIPASVAQQAVPFDRQVILARADLPVSDLKISNAQAGSLTVNCQIPTAILGPITVRRGWLSVDAKVRGRSLRFLATHLDGDCLPFTSAIQRAQAAELRAGPGATELPLVLVGDRAWVGSRREADRASVAADARSVPGSPGSRS